MRKAGSKPSALKYSASLAAALLLVATAARAQDLPVYEIQADSIPRSLTGKPGDAERGKAIAGNRQAGLCILCHSGPFADQRFQGNLAPDMRGAGTRWNEGQLRLRIVDASQFNPDTIMPSYFRTKGLVRVPSHLAGKTILNAEQIEDIVAWLASLKD